jgi:hypothetical protein
MHPIREGCPIAGILDEQGLRVWFLSTCKNKIQLIGTDDNDTLTEGI